MITFLNLSNSSPFIRLKKKFDEAVANAQTNVEAAVISSFNSAHNEVSSRYVNIKFIDNESLIFFSNYESKKAQDINSHDQVSVVFYWNVINTQIRIKGKISKTSLEFNKNYFKDRSVDKNALAISSNQSQTISSYEEVVKKYEKVRSSSDLSECPEFWGGYVIKPYEIEFWKGNSFRLNKRVFYKFENNIWHHSILEP